MVYLFRKFVKVGRIQVEDDILSLHFVDPTTLVCGQIEGACSLMVFDTH